MLFHTDCKRGFKAFSGVYGVWLLWANIEVVSVCWILRRHPATSDSVQPLVHFKVEATNQNIKCINLQWICSYKNVLHIEANFEFKTNNLQWCLATCCTNVAPEVTAGHNYCRLKSIKCRFKHSAILKSVKRQTNGNFKQLHNKMPLKCWFLDHKEGSGNFNVSHVKLIICCSLNVSNRFCVDVTLKHLKSNKGLFIEMGHKYP